MKGLVAIFLNEVRAILRSKTLLLLLLGAIAWMFAAPHLFTGDGTESGFREMTIHYSLGGVAAMLAVALLVSATGSIAKERAAKRLALTMVRPVRYFAIAFGKILAHVLCGAVVLFAAASVEYVRQGDTRCRHVLRPVLPSLRQEAEAMYDFYMARTNTPAKVKAAKRETVLRLLMNRARDRYDTVEPGETGTWRFDLPAEEDASAALLPRAVRFRFSARFDQREDVNGELRLGEWSAAVSNVTQAVIVIPLQRGAASTNSVEELVFRNLGTHPVMMRPRRDIELLMPAGSFGGNLVRAVLELIAMLALLVSFGVFLGSSLGRPAALFTAIALLFVGEMAPCVVDQYADELESDRVDAIGLAITRAAITVTRPVSSLRPLEALSLDECVEPREVASVLAVDLVFLPILFAFLSSLVLPRKQDF